ncbi:hypothetical protein K438DRAFT_1644121 [Mycena galopus ATCC 62051]|nr:hypothetical protein K438DRAFT_1644121 [Mycena galopus ATCC 62051]
MQTNEEEIRVDDLWFSDGFIVIKAAKKCFRVPKAILAARSKVFADMFASGTPDSENREDESIDGTPVVVLYDSPEDVEVFLRAIFDSSYFMPPPKRAERPVILGILRLSHKYEADSLFNRALQHVSVQFERWNDEQYRAKMYRSHLSLFDEGDFPDLTVITTLRKVGALWLLPIVYYHACRRGAEGLKAALDNGEDETELRLCLSALPLLSRATCDVYGFLDRPVKSKTCLYPARCNLVPVNWWTTDQDQGPNVAQYDVWLENWVAPDDPRPLEVWVEYVWESVHPDAPHTSPKFCGPCYAFHRARYEELLGACWKAIPSWFGLPDWGELQNIKKAAALSYDSV